MAHPDEIDPVEIAGECDVTEDQAEEVLYWLVKEGWLLAKTVQFNKRSEGNLELPDE